MKSALTDACTLKIGDFEGPFDLLFFLIEKDKIDLYDIPIVSITDQYMTWLAQMQEMDLEVTSEFLVMAATLLHIKSRMLLPVHREESGDGVEDPREELIMKLVEYKRFKEFSQVLSERSELWGGAHVKLPEVIPERREETPLDLSPQSLRACYEAVIQRIRDRTGNVRRKMERILDNEKVSLKSKIHEILHWLSSGAHVSFLKLFNPREKSRLEVATGFLAMLEVVKLGRATVEQERMFGDITILPRFGDRLAPSLEDADDKAADVRDGDVRDERNSGHATGGSDSFRSDSDASGRLTSDSSAKGE